MRAARGFTLIELLVAISIVAILAAVGLVVYSGTQKTARISKRVQDLQSIRTAIELFKSSTGKYPISAATYVCVKDLTSANSLTPNYMAVIPDDPSGTSYCYEYFSDTNGNEYKLRTNISLPTPEMGTAQYSQQPSLLDPARDGNTTNTCVIDTTSNPVGWAYYTGGACLY